MDDEDAEEEDDDDDDDESDSGCDDDDGNDGGGDCGSGSHSLQSPRVPTANMFGYACRQEGLSQNMRSQESDAGDAASTYIEELEKAHVGQGSAQLPLQRRRHLVRS